MMKNIKYICMLFVAACFVNCSNDMEEVSLPAPLSEAEIVIQEKTTSTPNMLNFEASVSQTAQYIWNFGNGATANGKSVTASFPFKGDYKGTLTIITKGGLAVKEFTTKITEDNYELVSDPLYATLSGGVTALEGRTWVIDSLSAGHLGVGPTDSPGADWWNAQPKEKSGLGIYDDEITFVLKGAKFIMKNNGTTFVNGAAKDIMLARGATILKDVGDFVMNYTPGNNWSWSIKKLGGKNYIVFPDGQGFFMFFTPGPYEYEILSISDDAMYLRQQIEGLAWYFKLIRKK